MIHHVYRYGQQVTIGKGMLPITGTVLACEFRGPDYGKLIYLVSWWHDAEHKSAWLDAVEVESSDESEPRAVFMFNAKEKT